MYSDEWRGCKRGMGTQFQMDGGIVERSFKNSEERKANFIKKWVKLMKKRPAKLIEEWMT